MQPTFELATACQELLGWEDRQLWDLLSGASVTCTLPARQLEERAGRADAGPVDDGLLIFKGGKNLSKAYGIIERFSEDVDACWPRPRG